MDECSASCFSDTDCLRSRHSRSALPPLGRGSHSLHQHAMTATRSSSAVTWMQHSLPRCHTTTPQSAPPACQPPTSHSQSCLHLHPHQAASTQTATYHSATSSSTDCAAFTVDVLSPALSLSPPPAWSGLGCPSAAARNGLFVVQSRDGRGASRTEGPEPG